MSASKKSPVEVKYICAQGDALPTATSTSSCSDFGQWLSEDYRRVYPYLTLVGS